MYATVNKQQPKEDTSAIQYDTVGVYYNNIIARKEHAMVDEL